MSKTSSLIRLAAASTLTTVIAVGAVACGPAKDSASPTGSSGTTTATGSSSPAAAKSADKPAFKGSGTFQVNSDLQPGTYKTSGNTDGACYWELDKDASGDADSIIANDNVTGDSYVTIAKGDGYFTSTDCKDWYAVTASTTGTPKATVAGDGMYKVGTDIAAGTYKTTASADGACYWERDKDASHSIDSVVANDNVTGAGVVTISSTDVYFKTSGCGDWTKSS